MASPTITSRRHALIGELQTIRDDRDSPLMFLEGPRLVTEVLGTDLPIEIFIWTEQAESMPMWSQVSAKAKRKFRVSEKVFMAISDVESPQGILAIARCPVWDWRQLLNPSKPGDPSGSSPIVILDGLQDPGNVATIIRTAEAAGSAGIVTTPGTAHVYSPKALRGAAGSTLRLPILEHRTHEEILRELGAAGVRLIGTTAKRSPPDTCSLYADFDFKTPCALVLGQEGGGLSTE